MIIEYVEGDENRIRWSYGVIWHYADLDDLIRAYESVRHGHWVKSEYADDGYCSVCKCDMPMYREDWKWKYFETPYCPNCGAKMDEVEK